MSFDMVKDTELYVNNGETFTFDKPIPNSILANDIFFSHSGKKIIIDNQDVAEIFDYSENGNLSFVQGF